MPPGGDIVLGVRDSPPLQTGRYFIAVYNPNGVRVCYRIRGRLERELDSTFSRDLHLRRIGGPHRSGRGLLEDHHQRDATGQRDPVGIRVEHPRESDLAIRLVNPGRRQLVAGREPRGRRNGQGFGSELVTVNGAFSHVAFVYDRASTRGVLYVNGVNVAEGVFPGYAAGDLDAALLRF